jgi:predicted DNA-binding transcriptional regulator AlpA
MTNAHDTDRYLTIAELIERWPIGRTKTYELVRAQDFPEALVLVRDRHGRPRSMGFLLSEIAAFEQRFRVPVSELDFDADQQEHDDLEPNLLPEVPACLPAAKKAMPLRKVA